MNEAMTRRRRLSRAAAAMAGWLAVLLMSLPAEGEETLGRRPYEMVWAGRTEDTRPPLLDFEDLKGWTIECRDAEATWSHCREQQIWGRYVGKLVYRATDARPVVTLRPPEPIAVGEPFDCVNVWVYGNNWAWAPEPTTPQVAVDVLLSDEAGREVSVSLGRVRWKEWWLMHRKLSPDQLAVPSDGATLTGIRITGGRNRDDRVLYFDNLAIYTEVLPTLNFEPRPLRGIQAFVGQTTGTNTGPGRLPFPNREETILPDNGTRRFEVRLEKTADEYAFHYRGDDGRLVYRYRPATGTLSDLSVEWPGRSAPFRPTEGGGVFFVAGSRDAPVAPEKVKLLDCHQDGDTVVSSWRCRWARHTADVTYTFRLWQKSLVVDVKCLGGHVAEFHLGAAAGASNPRLVTVPYLAGESRRPAVLVTGPPTRPLFVTALIDHCRSNASSLFMVNGITDGRAVYNGGARYLPKTNGTRNDCFERLFLTVSPRFQEVLPNVPNPGSPWMHVTGERLWRAHGASNREHDYAHWKRMARYGMTKVVITDHETGWRDGGESFTFRTRAAPGKGGDKGQKEYARRIRALGFCYGIYNNYTDFAPVNRHWDEDCVTRLPDGDWRRAWARCYNPKPSRAVEFEARLAPIIQEKFNLDTAYCDVHTAVRPWDYCDFDARVPGAGTFAATFYAYGEIMLHQKKTWNGPVYSEGNNHWYYCGLTDGNYGQDQAARLAEEPWLVDFDLCKLHPLCCNFGMGNPGMFYGRDGPGTTPEQREARLDRFLAATLAFGHTGFLVTEGGTANAVRSYFNLQQVHAAYARAKAAQIRYADEQGNLLDTSAAVANGAFRRSQIATTYSDGVRVIVNGHPRQTWKTPEAELPPNGWFAEDTKTRSLVAFSALIDGHRADYVDSPAYVYADGRGHFTCFEKAASDGQVIAHKRPDGTMEVIPVGECLQFGVSLKGHAATAIALDEAGSELGPAETRLSRGLVYVTPVPRAFSYVLRPSGKPAVQLTCDRREVVPGETVMIQGKTRHELRIPPDVIPGTRLWRQLDNAWIDFTVVPMVDAKLSVDQHYRLSLTSRLPAVVAAEVTLAGQGKTVKLLPKETVDVGFAAPRPLVEEVRPVSLSLTVGELAYRHTWWLKAEESIPTVAEMPVSFAAGQCLRDQREENLDGGSGAQVHRREPTCGGVRRPALFMHPPYKTGVGYSFALCDPIELPQSPHAVFRCRIGKEDGSDPGDGILFQVHVVAPDGRDTCVAQKQWTRHSWTPLQADLSPWAGTTVRIKLVADVGPADDSSGDWAAWTDMRIESNQPVLCVTRHDSQVALRRQPGPYQQEALTIDDLRTATGGTLHFQGMGLQHGREFFSFGELNDVPIGPLPEAAGNELQGTWSDASVALDAKVIAALRPWNRLNITNPGCDYFKIRRVWIELNLADGRRASSRVTVPTYSQPPTWQHAEGTGVAFGEAIDVEVRFATK